MREDVMESPEKNDPRPRSAVSTGVGFVGLAGLGLWCVFARLYGLNGPLAALAAVVACGVPMALWSLLIDKVQRNPSTGIDWQGPPRTWRDARDTAAVKIAGLWATWAIVGFVYFLGRWYWRGDYLFAMDTLGAALPLLLIGSVPYVWWLDRRLIEPRDGAWAFGHWLLGGEDEQDTRGRILDHARAWAVKGFFTAFMISTLPGNWQSLMNASPDRMLDDPVALADGLIALMFLIDVTMATVGYVLTMRPLDSHIRSANPYAAGGTAALICYPPFVLMNSGGPLDYGQGGLGWARALSDHPLLQPLWAFLLIGLTGIYAWATVAFGLRFSNLTNRGILTHGPYRWARHPAYLAKNSFWWLAALPMLTSTGLHTDAIRNCCILAIVNGVYYWRARTEERHLLADPAYVAYSGWMVRNGPVTRLLTMIGARRATLPAAAE
jgi:protein-S-isoprenylcysteine O-methyltransferase Ste14